MFSYSWHGNLRELSNAIKRATLLAQGSYITENDLPESIINSSRVPSIQKISFSTKDNEKDLIINALKEVDYNKTEAAKLLNITRKTLYNKLKAYGINL